MNRSYSVFREIKQQPYNYSAMAPSDHEVHHSVIMDSDGRQITPIILHGPNGETYVLKAEKQIVEHSTVTPASRFLVSEYGYKSDEPGNQFPDLGSVNFDHPEEIEEFINKLMIETSRGQKQEFTPPAPAVGKKRDGHNFYELASNNGRNYQILSKPTNEIGPAMDFLKEAIKNGEVKRVKPIDQNKGGYEMSKLGNNNGVVLPMQFGQTRFPPGKTLNQQKKEQNTSTDYSGKIDSREAAKRYGKLPSRVIEEGEHKGSIITSREAMVKYNGAFVP
ncbi:hypothetical protein M9H77_07408 [Catharanthus roseus]|uniref:Uncharacterized protein n=1 Tax=Catharanthus roseus TaxID=4058 RepID=A0ACC0BV45_CATRO|nr:hypothetical protein M9H77_07408 [Catharanthus roseus]